MFPFPYYGIFFIILKQAERLDFHGKSGNIHPQSISPPGVYILYPLIIEFGCLKYSFEIAIIIRPHQYKFCHLTFFFNTPILKLYAGKCKK